MTWTLILARPAERQLRQLPKRDRQQFAAVLLEMRADPFQGDVARLKGRPGELRRRVGDWRVFFHLDVARRVVEITAIVRRTSTTYRR